LVFHLSCSGRALAASRKCLDLIASIANAAAIDPALLPPEAPAALAKFKMQVQHFDSTFAQDHTFEFYVFLMTSSR
jgi:hypothetical protein